MPWKLKSAMNNVTNHKYGRGIRRKYYHSKCYDLLFQWLW